MTKTYCDRCKKELVHTEKPESRWVFYLGNFAIETIEAMNGVWNGPDLCAACIREIVAKGQLNRPGVSGPED